MTESAKVMTGFNGSLAGFDKEMKALIYRTIEDGWTGRLSSNGHAILNHPSGLTVAVTKSARQLTAARGAIKRVEQGSKEKVIKEGMTYRCSICDFSDASRSKVSGHFVGNHVNRDLAAKARREKVIAKMPVQQEEEKETPPPPPLVGEAPVELDSAQTLVKWLFEAPKASIETIMDIVADNKRLHEENQKLRETLNALISLAKEI